jgi:hypothetical protein
MEKLTFKGKIPRTAKRLQATADEKVNLGQPGGAKPLIRIFRNGGLSNRLEKHHLSGQFGNLGPPFLAGFPFFQREK